MILKNHNDFSSQESSSGVVGIGLVNIATGVWRIGYVLRNMGLWAEGSK